MNSEKKGTSKLFSEFPEVSTQQWEDIIIKDLKGADYRKKLIWETNEGIDIKPYYRAEDINELEQMNSQAGKFPFLRGNNTEDNNWLVRQDIIVDDIKEANKKALFVLNRGIESLGLILTEFLTEKQFAILFRNIELSAIEINIICGSHQTEILENFYSYLRSQKVDLKAIKGSITFNPYTELAMVGSSDSVLMATELIKISSKMPDFKVIAVHGSIFHNSGASVVQELAFSLATASDYLNKLTEEGLSIDDLAPKFRFDFAVGSNYFMEIAKIRAARLLWSKMVEAYDPKNKEAAKMFVHSTTSSWNKTAYDPYVNMLRTTTEAMSSVIGGTDSLTVNAFNESFAEPTEFGERIARNQQLLLKEESYLDKVVDPSAGSYYIESLTKSIAEQAWKLFLEVDDKGGFVEALNAGFIQESIKATASKRDHDIAIRKEIFLGTNQFPNFTENMEIELHDAILNPANMAVKKAKFETLKPYRGPQAFERLRYKTDVFTKKNKRPLVFMLTSGNLNMRKARAGFACNFFACAGFEVMDNAGFKTAEEGVKAAKTAKADIIVICSSDEEYAELAPKVKELAKDTLIVIAGYPKAIMEDLKAKGLKHFINVKSNVLETLEGFQTELGIK